MNKNKLLLAIFAIIASVLVIGVLIFVNTNSASEPEPTATSQVLTPTPEPEKTNNIVEAGELQWILPPEYGNPETVPHNTTQGSGRYNGVDFLVPEGTEVYSIGNGIVRTTGLHAFYGERLIVDYVVKDQLVTVLYANLDPDNVFVGAGDKVTGGEKIALVGKSGELTPKLHIEVRIVGSEVDPLVWLTNNIPKQ